MSGSRDQEEALGEPGRVEQRLVDPHRVHIGQPGSWIPCALVHRVTHARIELADRVPGHARTPDGVARQVGVRASRTTLAIDLEIRVRLAVVPPQRMFAERPELGIEIFLPELGGSTTWVSLSKHEVLVAIGSPMRHCEARSDVPRDASFVMLRAAAMTVYLRGLYQTVTEASGERRLDLLFRRPPVRAFDLGDAVADDLVRRIDPVEATRVAAEELGLIVLGRSYFCIVSIARQASSPSW